MPEIEKTVDLGREFESLLMGQDETKLDEWLTKAKVGPIWEIKPFTRGLEQDKSAVQAVLTLCSLQDYLLSAPFKRRGIAGFW